jgi:long-chain acyl-CoA synthetase
MINAASRPWLAHYPASVPKTVTMAYPNLSRLCTDVAKIYPSHKAATSVLPNGFSGTLTYAQIDAYSDDFALYLREVIGLKAGDRVAIMTPNNLAYPIVGFGVFKAGCILVNINPLYTAPEMGKQLADAKPQALVIINMFADKLPESNTYYAVPNVILTSVAEFFPWLKKTLVGIKQKKEKMVKPCPVPAINFTDALKKGNAKGKTGLVASYSANQGFNDVACLQYTGGTTGVSKGATLTHGNLIANLAQATTMIATNVVKGEELILTALPLYHIYAFTINFLGFWDLGGHNIIVPSPRPLSNLKKAFEMYDITVVTGVNTLYNGLLNEPWVNKQTFRALKTTSTGGMALQIAVAEKWTALTGISVTEGYGLSETSPVLTVNPAHDTRIGTIGIPVADTDVMIVDDDFNEVAVGMPGELACKGPQVFQGYWQKPEETAKVMRDGWFLTGDVAVMDESGYFKIVDRKKDMVIVSGFNVYPNEVEDALATHPGILEAAVIGVPDEKTGEAVKAFVVLKDESLTEEAVRDFCRTKLTAYKVPKFVSFKKELPKTPVGKILRKDLRGQ